jgi:hypothetical protein
MLTTLYYILTVDWNAGCVGVGGGRVEDHAAEPVHTDAGRTRL